MDLNSRAQSEANFWRCPIYISYSNQWRALRSPRLLSIKQPQKLFFPKQSRFCFIGIFRAAFKIAALKILLFITTFETTPDPRSRGRTALEIILSPFFFSGSQLAAVQFYFMYFSFRPISRLLGSFRFVFITSDDDDDEQRDERAMKTRPIESKRTPCLVRIYIYIYIYCLRFLSVGFVVDGVRRIRVVSRTAAGWKLSA